MKNTPNQSLFARPTSGFSLVEMIGVLAIIAILAVVIVPKVFSTIASSRVTSTVGSVTSMKTAVTEFAGKYGTIPLTTANNRIDDLLVTTSIIDSRFVVKIGTQPGAVPVAGGTWDNATGAWVATGGASQAAQTRLINLAAVPAAVPGAAGTNYMLDGVTNMPAGSRIVSAVLMVVTTNEARELSQKIDGDTMTQPVTSVLADTVGKVTYAAPIAAGTTTVYIYLAHQ